MQKIINSNTAKYQPMLTDNLVLDDKPTVNSFNSVTSDGVARAIAGASGEVPAVTEADNGKVLTAVYDEGGAAVEWAEAQGGGEYSAGTGISISAQDEISVDTTVIATKNDLNGYQPAISDLETIRSGASAGATAVQPSQLASVATSGSYADLSNKPTIPTVDQSYSASSTNAQSGTAVAGALATVNQVPASTSADENKVLTVNSSGNAVWATAQGGGGGSSYTFSAPLRESSGTVVLDVDTDELNIAPKTTALSAQREISAAESGYAWYLGNLTGDTSDTVYTFTFNNVPVSNNVAIAVNAQGKHIYPLLIGETYGGWGNQWIIPTALTFNNDNTVSGSFNVCFKSGEQDYPTHLDSYGTLSWASVLVFVVASDVPASQVSSSSIYGSTTSGSPVSYSTGGSVLMVKHPVPSVTSGDNGKVLKATYSNGVGSFGWDTAPSDLPSVTGNAGKVLTVNSGATGVEWATAQGGNVTDYAATYISSSNKPSNDWCSGIQTAMGNGQRIGLFVKMLAFSGSYSSGRIDPYDSNAKIYLPLVSRIDKSQPDQYTTFVYEYNFFLYDGVNKLKITLTQTFQNDTNTFVWSTPTISQ